MTFASLAQILVQLGANLPALLTLLNQVYQAWQASPFAGPPKVALAVSPEDMQHVKSVVAVAHGHGTNDATMGGRFDEGTIARLMQFAKEHPALVKWVFSIAGIQLPAISA